LDLAEVLGAVFLAGVFLVFGVFAAGLIGDLGCFDVEVLVVFTGGFLATDFLVAGFLATDFLVAGFLVTAPALVADVVVAVALRLGRAISLKIMQRKPKIKMFSLVSGMNQCKQFVLDFR
jgi:hypothetical protein